MASEATYYWANKLANIVRGVAIVELSTVWISLHTADPTRNGLFTAEVAVGDYGRMPAAFDAAALGIIQNTDVEQWIATGADFGLITHAGLNDALTTGNMLYSTPLDVSKNVPDGDIFQFAAAAFTITQ